MAQHVDGFVIPIRTQHVAACKRLATAAGKVWRDHGALALRRLHHGGFTTLVEL